MVWILSEFECYNADDGENDADKVETRDDFLFGDAFFLIVVMQRSHEEGSLFDRHGDACGQLVSATVNLASGGLYDD